MEGGGKEITKIITNYKNKTIYLMVIVLVTLILIPVTPVFAFSLADLLAQTTGINGDGSTATLTSGHGFFAVLMGLVVGKLLGQVFKVAPELTGKSDLPANLTNKNTKEVVGFYAEWWGTDTSSFTAMSKNVDVIKTIAPFWATLQEDATVTDRGGDDHAAVVKFAHQNSISALLLVNNVLQGSSDHPIHTVLSSTALRAKAIDNLEAYIKKYDLDGINIDFEMVPAEDKNHLSAFMRELAARLKPQGYIISIDVFPKQDETNDVAIAYDYSELAKYADKIMLMTYDYHGSWSGAGPIADIRWVENNLKYALEFIPKDKLYLGIAGYGYDWSSKGVESLEYGPLMKLAEGFNISPLWDEQSKSPHFSYTGADGIKHQVWYENSESLKYKLDLVNKYNIAGTALWKLGEEDPGYWQIFKEKFLYK